MIVAQARGFGGDWQVTLPGPPPETAKSVDGDRGTFVRTEDPASPGTYRYMRTSTRQRHVSRLAGLAGADDDLPIADPFTGKWVLGTGTIPTSTNVLFWLAMGLLGVAVVGGYMNADAHR